MSVPTAVDDPHAMTREGCERRCDELRALRAARRDAAETLRDAREDGGDPADNAGLARAIQERDQLERRIHELEALVARARVVEPATDGAAGIGSRVRVRPASGTAVEFHLVGALETDGRSRRVSVASPVGRALLGRSVGDVVAVEARRRAASRDPGDREPGVRDGGP